MAARNTRRRSFPSSTKETPARSCMVDATLSALSPDSPLPADENHAAPGILLPRPHPLPNHPVIMAGTRRNRAGGPVGEPTLRSQVRGQASPWQALRMGEDVLGGPAGEVEPGPVRQEPEAGL